MCHDGREGDQGATFLCANGTIFNQQEFNCDWWYNVNCGEAPRFYEYVNLIFIHHRLMKKILFCYLLFFIVKIIFFFNKKR